MTAPTPPPLGQLKRTPRPDVALRERGWTMEYPCWWSCPGLGIRLTMAEAWMKQQAADVRAAEESERRAHGLLQPAGSGIIQAIEKADAAGATNTNGALATNLSNQEVT